MSFHHLENMEEYN